MGLPKRKKSGPAFGDMLSKTAKTKKPASAKPTMPVIETDDTVREAVDSFVIAKEAEKTAKATKDVAGTVIIDYTKDVQDKDGFSGKFRNSYQVKGNIHTVKFVSSNRFSINPEDEPELRELLGDDAFEDLFEVKYTVSLKPEVFEDDEMQATLMDLIGEHFSDFFDTVKTMKVAEGFDQRIYNKIKPEDLETLRTFCRQYKPSLR